MKNRVFSVLIITLFATTIAFSQEIKPGILAGINFQNLNGKNATGDKLENDLVIGYRAGVNVLFPIAPEISFQPGLLFSVKGAKNPANGLDIKYKINYLELPLNILYRGQLGNNYVLLGFGPYVAFALSGNVTVNDDKRKVTFQNTVETGDPATTPYLRRFDAGADIFAGYELSNGLYLTINTQLGLLKINPEDKRNSSDESVLKNTGFGLSAGFRF
ncbi:MAG TPA: porin family protein [Bacteroidales bacterium]|nr:porin family protein [Bacteroidales bacterium]